MAPEVISIRSSFGKLQADWRGANNVERAIIQLPGWKGDCLGSRRSEAIANLAVDVGIGCLRLNPRGHGGSKGSFEDFDLYGGHEDLATTMNFIGAEFGVERIGLVGTSVGGGLAAYVAACEPTVTWLCLIAARWNYKSTTKDLYLPNTRLRETGLATNWENIAKQITAPTLILHGKEDTVVHPADSINFSGMMSQKACRTHLIDCGHHINGDGLNQALGHIRNWLMHFA